MGGMMSGTGFGYGLIGLLFNVIIIVGIVVLVVWAVRYFSLGGGSGFSEPQNGRSSEATPRKILEKRYARGEITREQYQEMLSDLS